MASIRYIRGASELLNNYDGFVIDLWGVMHSGGQAFPEALEALKGLREAGKRIVILSNAPRRVDAVVARNREQGIAEEMADAVLSSGEVTWQNLKNPTGDFYGTLGRKVFLIGPHRDNGMKKGLDLEFVEDPQDADFFLLCGLMEHSPRDLDPTGYDDFLKPAAERGCPMVCANPDLVVVRGGSRETCAGAFAERYEALGGRVQYHGKPHQDIYHRCAELMGVDDLSRAIAVGDSLRTDVTGANRAGMAALFIAGGIHQDQIGDLDSPQGKAALEELCNDYGTQPVAALPVFRF
ncbi:TIGR01459 family HAD-type hydrolase [Kiloniella sp. b19]|uniref:TIGR01459 family HAD-type hydrolase n=1 Tax=Kiloniella sp. GXU_MW_B19 TaxID=3141326 RepID=UPI0031D3FD4D